MWEDEANKFGGKWIVRLRKGGEFQIFCFFFLFMNFVNLRLKFSVLGKPGVGHAGRAVHGGRGDLRRRRLYQVPGGHTQVGSVQLSCLLSSLRTGRHYDASLITESLIPYHMN